VDALLKKVAIRDKVSTGPSVQQRSRIKRKLFHTEFDLTQYRERTLLLRVAKYKEFWDHLILFRSRWRFGGPSGALQDHVAFLLTLKILAFLSQFLSFLASGLRARFWLITLARGGCFWLFIGSSLCARVRIIPAMLAIGSVAAPTVIVAVWL
jgi:hypothetical protein